MEKFLIVQLKPVSFIAGLTSLCVLMSCCTALSLCSSSWALPMAYKPFLAELSICITGDSGWQKPQMPEAPQFWLPRASQELKRQDRNTTFGISEFFLSKWSVVILFNFYFRIVYSLKYFNFMQWISISNQYKKHWNFNFYEERI